MCAISLISLRRSRKLSGLCFKIFFLWGSDVLTNVPLLMMFLMKTEWEVSYLRQPTVSRAVPSHSTMLEGQSGQGHPGTPARAPCHVCVVALQKWGQTPGDPWWCNSLGSACSHSCPHSIPPPPLCHRLRCSFLLWDLSPKHPWEKEAELVQRATEVSWGLGSDPCGGRSAYSAFLMGHNKVQWLEAGSRQIHNWKESQKKSPCFSKQGDNCTADSLLPGLLKERGLEGYRIALLPCWPPHPSALF